MRRNASLQSLPPRVCDGTTAAPCKVKVENRAEVEGRARPRQRQPRCSRPERGIPEVSPRRSAAAVPAPESTASSTRPERTSHTRLRGEGKSQKDRTRGGLAICYISQRRPHPNSMLPSSVGGPATKASGRCVLGCAPPRGTLRLSAAHRAHGGAGCFHRRYRTLVRPIARSQDVVRLALSSGGRRRI